MKRKRGSRGFTLVELSIVLVIIGLLAGGIVLGQSLISSAEAKAQITQIGKYNAAVVSFSSRFDALPGDMTSTRAAKYGFFVGGHCDGSALGKRDGNGLIDGVGAGTTNVLTFVGETALFWVDLTSPALGQPLIEGQFPTTGSVLENCISRYSIPATQINHFLPTAKIGHGNFVYVYDASSTNWFGVVYIYYINPIASGVPTSIPNISVSQAYSIDAKIDDGLPMTGSVQANYITFLQSPSLLTSPATTVSGGNSTSCYDTTTGTYSTTINRGNGANCALSFKMQQP